MATIEEMRRWMAGEDVETLPKRSLAWDKIVEIEKSGNLKAPEISEADEELPWSSRPSPFDDPRKEIEYEVVESEVSSALKKAGFKLDPEKIREKARDRPKAVRPMRSGRGKHKVVDEGRDAVLMFGKHVGQRISDLAKDADGRTYLTWMALKHHEEAFDAELMEIVDAYRAGAPLDVHGLLKIAPRSELP